MISWKRGSRPSDDVPFRLYLEHSNVDDSVREVECVLVVVVVVVVRRTHYDTEG